MNTQSRTRKLSFITGATLALAAALPIAGAFASDWGVDPTHVTAQFSVKHMMISTVRGQFDKVSGTVQINDADLTKSTIAIDIDPSSINTREPKRDAHLKSPDFFDVAKYPTLTFRSTKIQKAGKDKYKVVGDLTMHGISKPVTLAVTLTGATKSPWGATVRGVEATGTVSRKDWGLTWNKSLDAGGLLISDEVQLDIGAELIQQQAPNAS